MERFTIGLIFAAAIATFVVACQSATVKGSGQLVTQDREISCFKAVVLSGTGNLYLIEGDTPSLSVQAEDNIIDLLATEVQDGVLKLYPRAADQKVSLRPTKPINYYITAPCLEKITINGSGEIYSQGKITVDWLRVSINGGGEINLDVDVDRLTIHMAGAGHAKLSGQANHQELLISGSGELRAEHLIGETADLKISGSGIAWLNISDTLDIRISGAGDVRYHGSPTITQTISGSGRIQSLD